jgi:hypothetical protein
MVSDLDMFTRNLLPMSSGVESKLQRAKGQSTTRFRESQLIGISVITVHIILLLAPFVPFSLIYPEDGERVFLLKRW